MFVFDCFCGFCGDRAAGVAQRLPRNMNPAHDIPLDPSFSNEDVRDLKKVFMASIKGKWESIDACTAAVGIISGHWTDAEAGQ